MGRAYIANCPVTERRELLKRLDNSTNAEDRPANRSHVVRAIIRSFRSYHFSERDPDVEPRSSQTIAVPIMLGPNVLATIGLSFFRTALPRHKVAGQLGAPLIQAARRIEQSLALMGAGQPTITSTSRSSSRSARVA
jgi:IclR family mhp operon transcriptional activator